MGLYQLTYKEAAALGKELDIIGTRLGDEDRDWKPEEWDLHGVHVEIHNGYLHVGHYAYHEEMLGNVPFDVFVTWSVAMIVNKERGNPASRVGDVAHELFPTHYSKKKK